MSNHRTVFLSAISGNILEYYDFTVFFVFSLVIGRTFFPVKSEFLQVVYGLTAFAVGFLTRPIGGIFFGYIGDKYGRRISLIISMLGMTIPTFTIGLIPSYNDIGLYAPVILIIMRLAQGLCISGEGAGAAIFILEHHQHLSPGLTSGFVHGSNIAGTLIASFVGILIEQYFTGVDFAWRFAFLLGGFMGVVGFYLRLKVSETPIFRMLVQKRQTIGMPFIYVCKVAWRPMFITFCVGGIASSMLYLVKTINIFYQTVIHLDATTTLIYSSYAYFVTMVSMPIFGGLSDIIGKFKMIIIAAMSIFCVILPTFLFMHSTIIWQQILLLTILGVLAGGISGTAYIFIISLFSPRQRFSGVAFSYNLGIAMFGGTSPIISRWLVEKTSLFYSPAFYLMFTSGMFLLIMYMMRNVIIKIIQDNVT